jgi:NAD(P)H-hydrate epimerase
MKYVSVAEMVAIETEANAQGLSYEQMMENAGSGLAEVVLKEYGFLNEAGALGLVGSGNNGGDTLVALARLAREGWKTSAAILRARPENDPLVARFSEQGGRLYDFSVEADLKQLGGLIETHALLLDGVLGTGIKLPLRGALAETLDFVRCKTAEMDTPPYVLAVDCPSGVDCDSGQAAAQCIPADHTVTMAAVKHGLLKFPAYNLVGELHLVEIGLPEGGRGLSAWNRAPCFVIDADWVRAALPPRPLDAHKGTFGAALIVAGSANYTGAALLAGKAAYRAGAGLVTLAVPEGLHTALAGQFPEATWLLLPQADGAIAAPAARPVLENLSRATAMLVGPGFGMAETSEKFIDRLLNGEGLPPLVFDADGLKLLANLREWQARLPASSILTPHPGEMSVLTGLPVQEIQADRLETARAFSQKWGHVLVLKGAFTIVAAPDGGAAILPVATPALARAGTGDVLAGLIAGLRAQGMPAFEAAAAAVWIHAGGGIRAARALGSTAAVLAGDVLRYCVDELAELAD